jgi:putative transcriptional regulator
MYVDAHPSNERLMAYATGTLPPGLSVLVASHLTFCTTCRDRVARFEAIGGALLSAEAPAPMSGVAREHVLARLDEPAGVEEATPAVADPVLPAPLREILGRGIGEIRWRFLLPGLAEYRIEGFSGEEVSLLRARPGTRILAHTHEGEESTLVLAGALQDDGRVYTRGSVVACDSTHNHRPEIVGEETCICLIVMTGRMRFTGTVGRALNLFSH